MPLTLPTIISLSRLAEPAGPDVFNALARDLLNDEGGSALTNRATDKGGQTRFGISKRSHPDVDVVNLTRDGALAIYRAKYFDTARVAELPTVLAKMVFDGAVNHGVPSAGFMLQSAYNQLIQDLDIAGADPLKADGVTGDKTIAAIAALDPVQILALTTLFCSQRMIRYGSDATWSANGHGWSRRLWLNTFQSLMQGATAPAEAASV
ncbi:MAG: hypothetical protein H7Z12_19850 [Rhodospirillaceae bacterium]|nr:hypothetical protein [Rhodospirillales bacterium]